MPILYMLGKGGISVLQTSIFTLVLCYLHAYQIKHLNQNVSDYDHFLQHKFSLS